ncbi:hypothetical protein AcV7_001949 [Taiwanofungus camphoratus]|nr:hypothetical protein AcV7_001949 [Antrodia cinnamomea]
MNSRTSRLPSYVFVTPEQAQRYRISTLKGIYSLSPAEKLWRDRQPYFERCGYSLRPRYHPDWSPSWLDTNLDPIFCEDSIMLNNYNVIDATRHRDGLLVSIKSTQNDSEEIAIACFLSSPELMKHPANHCVSILDVLPDPLDNEMSLLIMPYLRPFDDPEFGAIGEVVDFVHQTLEGLWFLHQQGIAHRDCAPANIMMDGRPLFPNGHHPVRDSHSADGVYELTPLSRIDHPVRYLFIDFGLSTRSAPGAPHYVLGREGRDKEVPELSSEIAYDAFKVDIFAMGNLYDKEFVQKYHGLEFLQPLIDAMKQQDSDRRPNAETAFALFERIRRQLNSPLLRWRLRSRDESQPERVLYDTMAAAREGIYHLKRLVF